MAHTKMDSQKTQNIRCHSCRYWFQRCCHALALIEGDDQQPAHCMHFIIDIAPIADMLESAQW